MKELIFCDECNYHNCYWMNSCTHPKNKQITVTPIMKTEEYGKCYEINHNNDCKDFEKIILTHDYEQKVTKIDNLFKGIIKKITGRK